jgi:hypothetical protein
LKRQTDATQKFALDGAFFVVLTELFLIPRIVTAIVVAVSVAIIAGRLPTIIGINSLINPLLQSNLRTLKIDRTEDDLIVLGTVVM